MRFNDAERRNVKRFVDRGGLLFVDDHNHDIDGVFHKTATEEITRTVGPLTELPNDHPLYSAFFKFDGPPTTSHELNGWGDNLVHKHLLAYQRNGRIARAVQQQGLQLGVELPSRQQALSVGRQHALRREHRGVCPHRVAASRPRAASARSPSSDGCSARASFR